MLFHSLRAANLARQQEWDPDDRITLAFRGNELAGEVGEACNVIKKLERARLGIRGAIATTEQLAEELADVVICADLIAMTTNIDLDAAVCRKFNVTSERYELKTRMGENDVSQSRQSMVARAMACLSAWTSNRIVVLGRELPLPGRR